jgi:hypothetical protein
VGRIYLGYNTTLQTEQNYSYYENRLIMYIGVSTTKFRKFLSFEIILTESAEKFEIHIVTIQGCVTTDGMLIGYWIY